jgi:Beta-xylosidase
MSRYFCNPINCEYRYQFNRNPMQPGEVSINREAADPSVILFKGKYYLFASMTLSVWVSDDLVQWTAHRLPDTLPLYGYAPDAQVIGDTVIFTAPGKGNNHNYYRTRDILNGPYEEIPGTIAYDDPALFLDTDNRLYFYWGLSSQTPIWGVEVDPKTLLPIGEAKALIQSDALSRGYERIGEWNSMLPLTDEELEIRLQAITKDRDMAPEMVEAIRGYISQAPYIEGAWMNKIGDTYYLQYAFAGTQFNIYGDGVFEAKSPLGPFTLARNNPFSYAPGAFLPGAGHGSTFEDKYGNLWHAATMRISVNHNFERRIGIWPAGVDADGELFCNQRYGDWPMKGCQGKRDPFEKPDWFLLSKGKAATASSYETAHPPQAAVEENVRTWWQAQNAEAGQWLQIDLGDSYDVKAVQVNFADDKIELPIPKTLQDTAADRYIEEATLHTEWVLEGSLDGESYVCLKQTANTDFPHETVFLEGGCSLRYIRLTIMNVPYQQKPCISGLRVFGKGNGALPAQAKYDMKRTGDLDMEFDIQEDGAIGHLILWGHAPEKLYHNAMTYDAVQRVGALVKGTDYYVRVDSFNENGITEGSVRKL